MTQSNIKEIAGKAIEQIKQDLLKLTPQDRFQYMKYINGGIFYKLGLVAIFNDKEDCVGYKFKDEGDNNNEICS